MDYAQKDGVDQPATLFTSFAAQQKSSGGTVETSDIIEFRLNGASLGWLCFQCLIFMKLINLKGNLIGSKQVDFELNRPGGQFNFLFVMLF